MIQSRLFVIERYVGHDGVNFISEWLHGLKDAKARARIETRLGRLTQGNFGDCKPVGSGVWELRIDYGPGYRIYYSIVGKTLILLLCGGDKRKQNADIERALGYLQYYRKKSL